MSAAASRQLISFGPLEFDAASGLLYRGQHEILLPLRAGKVLEVFLRQPGDLLSKDELLGEVWKDAFVGEDSLTQAISMIRSALGDDPRDPTYIQTIPKRGYRFIAEVRKEPVAEQEPPVEAVATLPTEAVAGVGSSLGHFEILGELGAGAMGVVYRARDTILEREVAIKLLSEDFTSDPGRVARFEREAKLLAAVSHPNIAAIYSLEATNSTKFPVMELVEGETMEQRLRSGPIKMEEALEIARQIASALEAAHERGVIHRDLKPANIKLAPSGQVKVLDFGLAKALDVQVFGEGVSESPTESITIMGSRRGSIVGTAAYMSPEQARGQAVGKQADIWAFGCVLYEMLTARRPFEGDTVSDTIAGVLEREPKWDALPQETPRAIRRLLRRCLSKGPDSRLHDIADARIEIEEALRESELAPAEITAGVVQTPLWRRAIPWSLAAVATIAALVAFLWGWRTAPDVPHPMLRVSIVLPQEAPVAPPGSSLQFAPRGSFVLSADASKLVYVAWVEDSRHELWFHDMRSGETQPLPDTVGAYAPFFSPDGNEVGFFADGKLKTMRITGRQAQVRADAIHGYGGTWRDDGSIYYVPDQLTGILRVPASGGAPETITTGRMDKWPVFVADRNELLVTAGGVWRQTLGTFAPWEKLLERGAGARYAPTGHLFYGLDGSLLASRLAPDSALPVGRPEVMFDDVMTDGGVVLASCSDDGTLVYAAGSDLRDGSLMWRDRSGIGEPTNLTDTRIGGFGLSPDGTQLVYTTSAGLWLHEMNGAAPRPRRLAENAIWLLWHPSGEAVFFTRRTPEGNSFFRIDLSDASMEPAEVIPAEALPQPQFAVNQVLDNGLLYAHAGDLWFMPFADDGMSPRFDEQRRLTGLPGAETFPQISPDGRWLAYASNKSGLWDVYVASYPDLTVERRVSHSGGDVSLWSPDGREIIYRIGLEWYSVALTAEPELELADPVRVLSGPYLDKGGYSWDLSTDGRRFLVLENPDLDKPITELVVITNFFDELKRRVPTEQ